MFSREQFTNWCKNLVFPGGASDPDRGGVPEQTFRARWPIRSDIPNLVTLDELVNARPWGPDEFAQALRKRNSVGQVVELSNSARVVGGMIYQFFPKNLEIIRFMVHPEFRESGVVSALLNSLKDKLSAVRGTYIDAIIDEYDLPTQQLFHANGFRAVGVVKEHFQSLYETSDGYRLRYLLKETP
jgi:ribosomal protein S18 acetylase RimI-like enzyme